MAGHHNDEKHGHHHAEGLITGKMIIQDVLAVCPQAEAIFIKHLGPRALSVPGAKTEAIEFLAAMNDYHEHILLEELNQVCKIAPGKAGHF